MMTRRFHALRRLFGASLLTILIGLPFLRIHGESAFRFDVPTLRLLFFGTGIWMQDFFIVLVALIFLTFFILFATTIFGRVWCGWLCPQTVLIDVTTFVEKARKRKVSARVAASGAGIAASATIAASFICYFVSPYDLPLILRTGGTNATIIIGSWTVLAVVLFLDLIALRRGFCATACPYAKMQGVLFDDRTLIVVFNNQRANECMHCNACVISCPVNIDIREGSQSACIHCAECVDACTEKMSRKNRTSLIQYRFGLPGKRGSGVRVNPLLTGVLTAVTFVFLLYLTFTRMPFDMNIHMKHIDEPSILADNGETKAYVLSLRNMGQTDLALELNASASTGEASVSPHLVLLKKGSDITTVPITIVLQNASKIKQHTVTIVLTLSSKPLGKSLEKRVTVILPLRQ